MIEDPDIVRAAKLLIDRHGKNAPMRATRRVDDLLEAGDTYGAVMWNKILQAIDELQRSRRDGEPLN